MTVAPFPHDNASFLGKQLPEASGGHSPYDRTAAQRATGHCSPAAQLVSTHSDVAVALRLPAGALAYPKGVGVIAGVLDDSERAVGVAGFVEGAGRG
jgi:hypothetical protein